MTTSACTTCLKPKATFHCGVCDNALCKSCAIFLDETSFAFLKKIPDDLKHKVYCSNCHDEKVAPELARYNGILEKAKDVNVYFKTQGKETRTLKRKEPPVKVEEVPDYDEALLRLAFLAAELGYNGLIDVQMNSKKVKISGYQTTVWSATGIPTHVDPKKLNIGLPNPN